MYNPYSLEGKTILITGAASGIGKATSIESSKMGAKIVAVDLNVEGLEGLKPQLEGEGHLFFGGNLCNEDFLKQLGEETPALDGVFLCAGVSDTTPVKFITEEKINRVFDVNLTAPIMMLKQFLVKKKINVNHQDGKGLSPLHYCAQYCNIRIAKLLLKNNANVNISDSYGNNPLWTAVFSARGNYQMVKLFVKYGADAYNKNKASRSPIDFAEQIEDSDMVKILLNEG